jgi:ferric-dicitrate binding protein FerR (iron transport regulator)
MNSPSDKQAELRDLLRRLSDQDFSEADARRLNDLLHGDPAACELYLDHCTLEAQLRHEFSAEKLTSPIPPSPRAATRGHSALGAGLLRFAAAVLLGAALTFVSLLAFRPGNEPVAGKQPEDGSKAKSPSECVATLLFADNCEWAKRDRLIEGERLPAGPLHLERGLAVLRFDGGAAVVLQGPAELDIESRGAARLANGRLTVRAPQEAAGFTLRTPANDVVDLGTEFAVVVERSGATELHVLEGEVAYGKPGMPEESAELLGAGKAVRFDQAKDSEARPVPLNAPRFAELISQAKIGPREDLLLAYEGFDYPIGKLPLANATGGFGWSGPWFYPGKLPPGDTEHLTIALGKLQVPWSLQGGRGPMLESQHEYVSRRRMLAQPIRLDEDGVYYVSVLVRWDTPPTLPAGQTLPAIRLVLRCSDNFNGDHVMFNLPAFHRPQIDIRSGAIFTSTHTVPKGETQLWVGKIVARKQGEDEVFFRVYGEGDALDTIEPASWHVRSRGISSEAKLDLLLLTKFGGGTCWWDEIRIGKSWRAVVPTAVFAKKS